MDYFVPGPIRLGDIYILNEPQWCPMGEGDPAIVNHGFPWRYDTFVPVIFAGMDLKPQSAYREIKTVNVVATLSAFVRTNRPSGAGGQVLDKAIQ